jgi:hypothetical protein
VLGNTNQSNLLTLLKRKSNFNTSLPYESYGTITSQLLLNLVVLSGNTYQKVSTLFGSMGIPIESETKFYKNIIPTLNKAIQQVTDDFIWKCRLESKNSSDLHVVIDAGWSHPGWWARECTVIAIDGETGLPIGISHIQRDVNFEGSSKGSKIHLYFDNLKQWKELVFKI